MSGEGGLRYTIDLTLCDVNSNEMEKAFCAAAMAVAVAMKSRWPASRLRAAAGASDFGRAAI